MAKAVADTDQDNAGGYSSNGWDIRGFSHMHDSGTGGVNIPKSKLREALQLTLRSLRRSETFQFFLTPAVPIMTLISVSMTVRIG